MNKKVLITVAMTVGAILFIAGGIYAAKEVPETIRLEDPAYAKHKKGIAILSHKKHQEDYAKAYPEFYKNGCGECHHDKDGKPLSNLKAGDDVQRCIECHKKLGEMPGKEKKAMRAKKLSKKEQKSKKLEYQAEAFHYNCKACHKKYKKKTKKKNAPITCAQCHPKGKKKK